MNTRRPTRLATGLLAVSLLAAACTEDDDATASESSEATEQATTAPADTEIETETETETEMASSSSSMADDTEADATEATQADIVDTAVAAGDFTTLVAAVQAAGLEETLRGEGPFTVFAPTDEAFTALPAGTVDQLLADPEGALAGILTYHVVSGEVMAADVAGLDGQAVTTVNGATFTVAVGTDGAVSLTDAAGNQVGVVQTDIETSNGVIHVLDGVLLPG